MVRPRWENKERQANFLLAPSQLDNPFSTLHIAPCQCAAPAFSDSHPWQLMIRSVASESVLARHHQFVQPNSAMQEIRKAEDKQFVHLPVRDVACNLLIQLFTYSSCGTGTSIWTHLSSESSSIFLTLAILPTDWFIISLNYSKCSFFLEISTIIEISRLQAQVQLITRSLLHIGLSIVPDFRWEEKIHGGAKTFFILIRTSMVRSSSSTIHLSFVSGMQNMSAMSPSPSRCSSPSLPITTSQ